jgi:hypothetical protein
VEHIIQVLMVYNHIFSLKRSNINHVLEPNDMKVSIAKYRHTCQMEN